MKINKCMLLMFGALSISGAAFGVRSKNISTMQQTSGDKPVLVVNIVVSGLPYDFATRFGHNLSEDGLKRFMRDGVVFKAGRYNYMPTTSVSSLATLTTGTYPYMHGVVGSQWRDILTGSYVSLVDDSSASGLGCEYGQEAYSNHNLLAPTLGDRLKRESPKSKVITIAADPASSIVLGGLNSDAVYWFNSNTASWITSNKYTYALPEWVVKFNDQYKGSSYLTSWKWRPEIQKSRYVNCRYCSIDIGSGSHLSKMRELGGAKSDKTAKYSRLLSTPLMNDLLSDFTQQALIHEKLGADNIPDILNICFDAPREAMRRYGPESVEAEDMFYQTDRTIGALVQFISAQFAEGSVLFVLTSDHGVSESFDVTANERDRFSGDQFRAIINSFLCAQYGGSDWVSGYYDRRIYINRSVAFNLNLSLDEVQRRASDFALQFRGLARVVPSCDLRGGSAGDPYMQRLRNGYYPKRSGDLLVDLVPNWIEESPGVRASAGSAYDYDTHVPLMIMGGGVGKGVVEDDVDMASLPVTIAYILGIQRPDAATADPLVQIIDNIR